MTTQPRTIVTHSEDETAGVGRDLAPTLRPGAVVLLSGDLGAGKTALTRGLAEGLGARPDEVSSPTFTIIQEYRGGRLPLIHVDLYRLNDPREVEDLGLDEIAAEGVLAVEWAEKLPGLARLKASGPGEVVRVLIEHGEHDERRITLG